MWVARSYTPLMRLRRVTNQIEKHASREASRLRVIFGPDQGMEVRLPQVGLTVGADPSCEIVLKDQAVSARHCTVRPGEHGFEVNDLGSKNGTWLDGVAVTK